MQLDITITLTLFEQTERFSKSIGKTNLAMPNAHTGCPCCGYKDLAIQVAAVCRSGYTSYDSSDHLPDLSAKAVKTLV